MSIDRPADTAGLLVGRGALGPGFGPPRCLRRTGTAGARAAGFEPARARHSARAVSGPSRINFLYAPISSDPASRPRRRPRPRPPRVVPGRPALTSKRPVIEPRDASGRARPRSLSRSDASVSGSLAMRPDGPPEDRATASVDRNARAQAVRVVQPMTTRRRQRPTVPMIGPQSWSRAAGRCQAAVARLALLGWLGGCAAAAAPDTAPAPQLPPGAIQVGRDLYQIPIGADADGCQQYRLYSPTLMVTAAISYRSRNGGFTIDRGAAVCDPASSTGRTPAARS
jgi:hypothetical protein